MYAIYQLRQTNKLKSNYPIALKLAKINESRLSLSLLYLINFEIYNIGISMSVFTYVEYNTKSVFLKKLIFLNI